MKKVDPANCTNFADVVDKSHISLSRCVKLSDLNVAKTMKELSPDVWAKPVSNGESNFMMFIIFFLEEKKTYCEMPSKAEKSSDSAVNYLNDHRICGGYTCMFAFIGCH